MSPDKASRFRSAVMRLSYLAQDRMDLCEPAKCLSQRMAQPRELGWEPVRMVARYLVGRPQARIRCRPEAGGRELGIKVFTDSDDARNLVSRKGTTGLVAFLRPPAGRVSQRIRIPYELKRRRVRVLRVG